MIYEIIWYDTVYDMIYDIVRYMVYDMYDMIWYMIWCMIWYMIYDMKYDIWYDTWNDIWYDIWHDIWYMLWYMIWYMIHDMINDMICNMMPRFLPHFWSCVTENSFSGTFMAGRGRPKEPEKTCKNKYTKQENMQKWYQNRLKSDIWAPPGRHRGHRPDQENSGFRTAKGQWIIAPFLAPFWAPLGTPWASPGRPRRSKNTPRSGKRRVQERSKKNSWKKVLSRRAKTWKLTRVTHF